MQILSSHLLDKSAYSLLDIMRMLAKSDSLVWLLSGISYRVMKSLLMLALKPARLDLCQKARKALSDGMLLSLLACPLDPRRMEDERRKRTVSLGATISCSLQKSRINAPRASTATIMLRFMFLTAVLRLPADLCAAHIFICTQALLLSRAISHPARPPWLGGRSAG